jgi:hypothetical protein
VRVVWQPFGFRIRTTAGPGVPGGVCPKIEVAVREVTVIGTSLKVTVALSRF